jgi:polyisoprenoid-binding protein YceI
MKFPVAHFASASIRDVGGNRYEVAGKLTLKGITRDCTVPITVRTDAAGNRIAEGTFAIRRLDYKVGEGEWADTATVDNDILVHVRMTLAPAT